MHTPCDNNGCPSFGVRTLKTNYFIHLKGKEMAFQRNLLFTDSFLKTFQQPLLGKSQPRAGSSVWVFYMGANFHNTWERVREKILFSSFPSKQHSQTTLVWLYQKELTLLAWHCCPGRSVETTEPGPRPLSGYLELGGVHYSSLTDKDGPLHLTSLCDSVVYVELQTPFCEWAEGLVWFEQQVDHD